MIFIKPKIKEAQISVRIDSETTDKLRAIANKNGVKLSQVVRQILEEAV